LVGEEIGMQEIEYKPGKELWEIKANTIVKNVPVSLFDNCKEINDYIERVGRGKRWKADIQRIIDNFDPIKFGELFYCRKCKRLEDATHRIIVARKMGIKTVDVRVGGSCYIRYVKSGRLIRRDSSFLDTFQKMREKIPTAHKLDGSWLKVCAGGKWPLFSPIVDFRRKSYLDVGCNVGYSCIRAWGRMAWEVMGIDRRRDVLSVARAMKEKLGIKKEMVFLQKDWEKTDLKGRKFDIVSCMGTPHYFLIDDYEEMFKKLMDACNETLILELRLRADRNDIALTKSGIQTLPTAGWLCDQLDKAGFGVTCRFVWKPRVRELWVAEKVK